MTSLQPAVSQIERQADPQVSTLRRYVEVLGAELELRAVFPQGAVAIAIPPPESMSLSSGELATIKNGIAAANSQPGRPRD